MLVTLNFGTVKDLHPAEQQQLQDLADVFNYHQSSNTLKDKYYEGHILSLIHISEPTRPY